MTGQTTPRSPNVDPAPVAAAARDDSERISFAGICSLCGAEGQLEAPANTEFPAREFRCGSCGAALRYRDEATAIVDELGRGRHQSLRSLVNDPDFAHLRVYNTGVSGPTTKLLRQLPHYVGSYYFEDGVPGEIRDGVPHQDAQALTFDDDSFDLMTHSHVMEHVPDHQAAFAEAFRVIRPGGHFIFSVPFASPLPAVTRRRCDLIDGEIVHHLPPRFHNSPSGDVLVFTHFGADILDFLEAAGFLASFRRPHAPVQVASRVQLIVARKPHASRPDAP